MTTGMTVTDGTLSVPIETTSVNYVMSKKWLITPIGTTSQRRASTYLTTAGVVGDNHLHVGTSANFQAMDSILICGLDTVSGNYNTEITAISTVPDGTTLNLNNVLIYAYDVTTTLVYKLTRFISYDFNRTEFLVKVRGVIKASTKTISNVRAELIALMLKGGTVKATWDDTKFSGSTFAMLNLSINSKPLDPITDYDVDLTLSLVGKEGS